MPELPDLQVFSQSLNKVLKGKKLQKIIVLQTKKLNVPEDQLVEALQGQILKQVERSGKQLHFVFKNGNVLGLHLMLHGQMHWFKRNNPNKFTIFEMHYEGGVGLAVTDFQRQATPTLNPDKISAPDALAKDADYQFWKGILENNNKPIKTILLNQDVVRGIGNAYADEILYNARISPFSIAGKIPDAHVKALVKSIKSVLENAEKQILKNDPERISGEYRDFLQVHLPKQNETPNGESILQKPLASRKTYYTEGQKLFD